MSTASKLVASESFNVVTSTIARQWWAQAVLPELGTKIIMVSGVRYLGAHRNATGKRAAATATLRIAKAIAMLREGEIDHKAKMVTAGVLLVDLYWVVASEMRNSDIRKRAVAVQRRMTKWHRGLHKRGLGVLAFFAVTRTSCVFNPAACIAVKRLTSVRRVAVRRPALMKLARSIYIYTSIYIYIFLLNMFSNFGLLRSLLFLLLLIFVLGVFLGEVHTDHICH